MNLSAVQCASLQLKLEKKNVFKDNKQTDTQKHLSIIEANRSRRIDVNEKLLIGWRGKPKPRPSVTGVHSA